MERSKEILRLLGGCFNAQKTYGQDPSKIKGITKVFEAILSEYPLKSITAAFMTHLKQSVDFPTPADIVSILDPKESLDKPTYIQAKKWLAENKDAVFSLKERDCLDYVRRYEEETMSVKRQAADEEVWLTDEESKKLLNQIKE